ncbi:hypothetical protein CRN84_16825 [Budvicia aquatica]|uniref:Invasin domain-containing protein n=2 Tax=Budvicia aquatica TaxID=82979 RepID=A0A2C6DQ04_9GAMM|nr:hypothetical protein CRN84_16825 [Budvicia aquatica]
MLAVLIAVILVGSVVPVGAVVLSDSTGIIHGRAPTAVGDLYAVMPDGTTVVTNNVIVSQTATPSQFTVSSVTTGITPYDADGDTGLTMTPDMARATLVWKQSNGTPLTAAQLAAPLVSNFPNSTVTLEVHAPVTTTSTTGLPTTAGQVPFVTAYTVKVPAAPVPMPVGVKIALNGFAFPVEDGVPSTGFPGAWFDIRMNGVDTTTNSNYAWSVNQNHVTVSQSGRVTISSKPATGNKTVVVTARDQQGVEHQYTFATTDWFRRHGELHYAPGAADPCVSPESTPTPRKLLGAIIYAGTDRYEPAVTTRHRGDLLGEWGVITTVNATQVPPLRAENGALQVNTPQPGYGALGLWASSPTGTNANGWRYRGRASIGTSGGDIPSLILTPSDYATQGSGAPVGWFPRGTLMCHSQT